jgi:hypothetical protein
MADQQDFNDVPNHLQVKPLEWVLELGDGFRIFRAESPFGQFTYGTDNRGISYHQGPTALDKVPLGGNPHAVKVTPHEDVDHADEEIAKAAAERLHAKLVLEQIGRLTVNIPKSEPKLDPRVLAAVSFLRTSLKKYADDCQEARSWGGPTIYPVHPIDERYARNSAATLEVVEAAFKK